MTSRAKYFGKDGDKLKVCDTGGKYKTSTCTRNLLIMSRFPTLLKCQTSNILELSCQALSELKRMQNARKEILKRMAETVNLY